MDEPRVMTDQEYRDYLVSEAVEQARIGDWDPLIEYIEGDWPITKDIRKLIAQILKGELKKPNNRAPKSKTNWEHQSIAFEIAWLLSQGQPTESVVAQISKKYNISKRTVYNVKREFREMIDAYPEILKSIP